jgi:hypothetical protein
MKHKTQHVRIYDNRFLPDIDRGMAHVVRLLNRPDLWTTNCCQGHDRELKFPDAYVAIDGPAAIPFVHALLDDQITHPDPQCYIELLTVDTKPGESPLCIRWLAIHRPRVVKRFKRVLATPAFKEIVYI